MATPLPLPRGGFTVRINGFDMYCEVEGEGPLLVFLPGAFAGVDVFRPLVEAFRSRFTVLTADANGQGRSTLGPGPITYVSMTADLVRLFDHLGIAEADCFGLGDGGCCGLHLLVDFSHRIRSVSISSTIYAITAYTAFGRDRVTTIAQQMAAPQGFLKAVKDIYAQVSPNPDKFDEMARRAAKTWASQPSFNRAILSTIEKPTLVIASDRDEFVPDAAFRRLAEWIPGSKLKQIPGMGHVPGVFSDVLSGLVAKFVADVGEV
jgi:pimeloyl-ACP methyl ester carboxylesterase